MRFPMYAIVSSGIQCSNTSIITDTGGGVPGSGGGSGAADTATAILLSQIGF